ncbi:alpha/beta hydrolase [Rhodococcus sp. 06-470-2]|uniref:alpha/beta fold hydrolase n=1 Tax=unclassified Rhodococcus (in: high G+C Gram-positive bacteria) TaxID=192944 RepID=UPI000B9B6433|nr:MULTISPECIES: alpha/beta hydrolase [unclassified Rhodococcus (in: high G+C Gram-positive bacteria)]OZC65583.1 alpha/beta hydrolase [Rhodococcus sp. 06-470-2]OZE70842.1 alpha/beta hydrolase [Rhodococcus sp. 05-2221-1B]
MPTVITDDAVTLNYLDEGRGQSVVLIAGFCAPATTWLLQQKTLVANGYRVLALDRRGHGASEAPTHVATMERHGRDVANFLSAVGLDEAVLIGGSMGASTIWSYVSQFGTERVRAIVSVDQTPRMVNSAGWANGFYGLTEDNRTTFFDNGIPDTGHGRPQWKSVPSLLRLVLALRAMPKLGSPDTPPMRALLADHAAQDWRATIAGIDKPYLMVAARDSQFWPAAHAFESVDLNPLGRSVVLESCGHAANMDRPSEFNAAMLEFLDSIA